MCSGPELPPPPAPAASPLLSVLEVIQPHLEVFSISSCSLNSQAINTHLCAFLYGSNILAQAPVPPLLPSQWALSRNISFTILLQQEPKGPVSPTALSRVRWMGSCTLSVPDKRCSPLAASSDAPSIRFLTLPRVSPPSCDHLFLPRYSASRFEESLCEVGSVIMPGNFRVYYPPISRVLSSILSRVYPLPRSYPDLGITNNFIASKISSSSLLFSSNLTYHSNNSLQYFNSTNSSTV